MAWWVKLWLQHQYLVGVLVHVLGAPRPIQLSANGPGKAAEHGLSVWAPVNHVGDPDDTPGLGAGPVLDIAAIWGMK